jgi:hypothetical protein
MKKFSLIVAILSFIGISRPANAGQFHKLFHDGDWSVMLGVSHHEPPMCIMVNHSPSGNRFMAFKFVAGTHILIGQLYDAGWHIPRHTHVPLMFDFPGRDAFRIHAMGSNNSVFWQVNDGNFKTFLNDFSAANQMSLIFEAGNQQPWLIGLAGSAATSEAMANCIKAVDNVVNAPQPYSASPPSNEQPFSAPPAPTDHTNSSHGEPANAIQPPGPDVHV